MDFSVVMSTYSGERCSNLQISITSLFTQTTMPNQVVLVVDGPVSIEQQSTIHSLASTYPMLEVIWLEENVGRGKSRNIGIRNTNCEFVAVMDSDDIAIKDRFERSIEAMLSQNVDVVCGLQQEFEDNTGEYLNVKYCPEFNVEIKKALKFSCVVSNPTIFFRKGAWEYVNGYPEYGSCNEDYLFFLRLINKEFKFYCVQKPLIDVRISDAQRFRRNGFAVLKEDFVFRRVCVKEGYHSNLYAFYVLFIYAVKRLSPYKIQLLLNSIWRSRREC